MTKMHLDIETSSTTLSENTSYDVAALRIRALDENGNLLNYCNEPIEIKIDGPLEIIGPQITSLRGGMGGFYLKTIAEKGIAKVTVSCSQCENSELEFEIK